MTDKTPPAPPNTTIIDLCGADPFCSNVATHRVYGTRIGMLRDFLACDACVKDIKTAGTPADHALILEPLAKQEPPS